MLNLLQKVQLKLVKIFIEFAPLSALFKVFQNDLLDTRFGTVETEFSCLEMNIKNFYIFIVIFQKRY